MCDWRPSLHHCMGFAHLAAPSMGFGSQVGVVRTIGYQMTQAFAHAQCGFWSRAFEHPHPQVTRTARQRPPFLAVAHGVGSGTAQTFSRAAGVPPFDWWGRPHAPVHRQHRAPGTPATRHPGAGQRGWRWSWCSWAWLDGGGLSHRGLIFGPPSWRWNGKPRRCRNKQITPAAAPRASTPPALMADVASTACTRPRRPGLIR